MYFFSQSLAAIFLAAVGLLAFLDKLPILVFALYVGLSLATFVLYWEDKNAARNNKRRTPENTLHLAALLGGWPGALIGQQRLRHKTQKVSFRIVLWLTIVINVGLFLSVLLGVIPLPFVS